jgi:Tripartite tricarboxylate transporter TctB family
MSVRRGLDLFISLALLVLCASAWPEIWKIRQPSYAQVSPALWTSVSVAVFSGLCLLYFVRSAIRFRAGRLAQVEELPAYWFVNPSISVLCFVLFLLSIPYVGMRVASFGFVWVLLILTGERTPRSFLLDTAIAVGFTGLLFFLFSYVFGIVLPTGDLTGF